VAIWNVSWVFVSELEWYLKSAVLLIVLLFVRSIKSKSVEVLSVILWSLSVMWIW
jgi:hypothetical protein